MFPSGGSFPKQTVFDVKPAAAAAGCKLSTVKATSREHTTSLSDHVKYSTNPPTSGKHYQIPAQDGIYGDAPQDEELVHAQEHGRVIFWVKPSAPKDVRANIRALVEDDPYQMFLVPREKMPYEVAATAWDADPAPNGTGESDDLHQGRRQDLRRARRVPGRAPLAGPRADSLKGDSNRLSL